MTMPSRSQRMQVITRLHEMREDQATRQLAAAQGALDQQEQKLAELRRYAADYTAANADVMSPAMAVNRQAFLSRLREAERYQRKAVEQARDRCENQRQQWLLRHRDTGVFDRLTESCRRSENRQAEARLQKEIDDVARRAAI